MTEKKTTTRRRSTSKAKAEEGAERPDVPACTVTELPDDLVHVQPVNRADTPAVAALLLQHTEQPGAVRTVTAPEGWLVPAKVAKSAGVGA